MARFLALDADSNGLYLASANIGRQGVEIEKIVAIPDEDFTISSSTADRIGERLKKLLVENGIAPAPLMVGIGRDRLILKEITYPKVPPHEELAIVRFQVQKDLTDAPDMVMMDYVPAADSGAIGSQSCKATVVSIRKDFANAVRDMCDMAGVKFAALSPRPYAVISAARRAAATGAVTPPESTSAPVAVLSIWDRGGEFLIFRERELLFSRSVSAASIASEASLGGEIRRNLAVYEAQHPRASVQAMYVVDGLSSGQSWAGRLRTLLPIPVSTLDPLAGSPAATQIADPLHGRFLGPIGLLNSRTTGEELPVNFFAPRQPRAEPNKLRKPLLLGALLLVTIVAGLFLLGTLELSSKKRKLNALNQEKDSLAKTNTALKQEVRKLEFVEDFASREVPWLDVFYDLSEYFPDISKAKLISFDGTLEKMNVSVTRPGTPSPGPRPGPPPASGTTPRPSGTSAPKPTETTNEIAKLKLVIASEDTNLVDKFKDMLKPPYFLKTSKETGKGGSSDSVKQFTIETMLTRRKPDEFSTKLIAAPPPKPKAPPAEEEEPAEMVPFVDPLAPGEFTP